MSDFGSSVTINNSADKVFQFVCDPANMPEYLPTVDAAERQSPGRVRVRGQVADRSYDSDGWFEIDLENMTMSWGSDGENRYSGNLSVTEISNRQCKAEVHLDFQPSADQEARFQEQMGSREGVIQQGLDRAMMSIKQICEGETSNVPADLEPGRRYMS